MPDYTTQLRDIVTALNRPTISPWAIAGFTAVLAVLGGIVGQVIVMWLGDQYRLYKMRGVLYRELADMFFIVDAVMDLTDVDHAWREREIATHLNFRSEKYMAENQELYVRLAEHSSADILYANFHRVKEERNSLYTNASVTLRLFANALHGGALKRGWFRWFVKGSALLSRIDHHQRLDEELRRRMKAEGTLPSEDSPG